MHEPLFIYSTVIEEVSTIDNGFTNGLSVSPLKRITFPNSTDVSISLKEISTRNNKMTTQKSNTSIVSLSELKLIRYRLAVAFGICCIVALFMLPVIFYYVEGSELSDDLPTKGIGMVNVLQVCQ